MSDIIPFEDEITDELLKHHIFLFKILAQVREKIGFTPNDSNRDQCILLYLHLKRYVYIKKEDFPEILKPFIKTEFNLEHNMLYDKLIMEGIHNVDIELIPEEIINSLILMYS